LDNHAGVAAILLLLATASAGAADDSEGIADGGTLETVTVIASGVSTMDAASAGDVTREQIDSQPLLRPAAILENVPGLIVTQHSGEGKANQYFLRAFNLDHGTDLATEVDDVPVNMPTHAHGQGYTDLNFLIPELVSDLHYKKGPYYADEGDFATAGTVRVALLDELPPSATLGFGEDGYRRALAMGSTAVGAGTLLAAGEAYHNDGPFDVPDDYQRLNGVLRYHLGNEQDYWTATAMAYSGQWNATDQVPERAIDEGLIDRFGSLNPTDGGQSSRESLSLSRVLRSDGDQVQFSAYVVRYRLDLWSTFTYYLENPVYGDQMLQHDDRVVYGAKASKTWYTQLAGMPLTNLIGLQTRVDDIRDVGIFPTYQRQIIGTTQNAGVLESNGALYAESSLQWQPRIRTILGLREDVFDFDVHDKMRASDGACNIGTDPLGCDSGAKRASIFSPKLGIVLGPWRDTHVFIDVADGYHSNDARGVTRSGQNPAAAPVTALTRATSAELGVSTRPVPAWESSLDVFELKLKSELVFDGDAGVTAPSGASTRIGLEWGNRYQINPWLSADLNTAVTRARFDRNTAPDDLGCAEAAPSNPCTTPIAIVGRYIPNSPTNVSEAGLTAQHPSGWFGALRARHFGSSPLVEDDSAQSPPYTTFDAQIGFRRPHWLAALDVFNLLDTRWNDIEYYYVSRLRNELSPQPDYVVHPGVPRTLRARLQYQF
jgi:TonB-dependent receptor-like protein